MIKLMIADDDAKVCSAINLLLDQDKACWEVVGEPRTVNELFLLVDEYLPELLLLDWELPEERCEGQRSPYFCIEDKIRHLREINPGMYIIVLSSKPEVKKEAVEAGANSFVSKGDPPEIFLNALYATCGEPSIYFGGQKKKKTENNNFATILF